MKQSRIEFKKSEWLDIHNPSLKTMESIGEKFGFHILDLKDTVSPRQLPKVDVYDKYVFGILHFPEFDKKKHIVLTRELDFFIGKDYFVTARRGNFYGFDRIFRDLKKNKLDDVDMVGTSQSTYVFYAVVNELFNTGFGILDKIGTKINRVEDKIFSPDAGKNEEAVRELSSIRRSIIRLARIYEPQLRVIKRLQTTEMPFWGDETAIYFDDIDDHIEKIWTIIQAYEKQIDSLYETNEALISHRTNRIVTVLTVFSVAFLPLTLIASIYGMNVRYLPFQDHPGTFYAIAVVSFIIIFGTFAILKKRKWF